MRFLALATLAQFAMVSAYAQPADLEVGQVWAFEGAPQADAVITIRLLERSGEDMVAHISVGPVPLRKTADGALVGGQIAHMPFDVNVLKASLKEIVGHTDEGSDLFKQGYAEWVSANGGVFTISPGQAIEYIYEITGATERVEE
jgi:hypothetical protein